MDIFDIAIARKLASGGGGGGGATPIVITPNDPTAPSDTEVASAFQDGILVYLDNEDEWYKSRAIVQIVQEDKETHDIVISTYLGNFIYNSSTGWTSY